MVGHGGSSACSYLADPTSPIPSHCASIVVTSTVRVKFVDWFAKHPLLAQSYPALLRHILSPLHNLSPATKCAAMAHAVLGRQNVPCNSAYFVVPHRMDSNIHRDIYLLTMKEALYYILWYVYITGIFIMYLHLH